MFATLITSEISRNQQKMDIGYNTVSLCRNYYKSLVVLLVLGVCLVGIHRTDVTLRKLINKSGFGGQRMVACSENADTSLADTERPSRERLVNAVLTEYNSHIRATFDDLVAREVTSRDPELISLIRQMLDPPSNHMIKMSRALAETPQSKVILDVLGKKRNGFFIEAGGLDGERSSNTIYLEQKLGWTGLLVEMDPYFYTQLRGKNRRSWSINACIGPSDRPIKMNFKESSGGQGKLTSSTDKGHSVPCFPLESMLLALNTTHVDYFSLDVEGYELEVLRTIPFDRIDISALSVEYVHGKSGKEEYKLFMEKHGFVTFKEINHSEPRITLFVNDFIFVNKNIPKSQYAKSA